MSHLGRAGFTSIALCAAVACSKDKEPTKAPPAAPTAAVAPTLTPTPTPAPADVAPTPTPTPAPADVAPTPTPTSAPADVAPTADADDARARCTLGGDPILLTCTGGGSMAATPGGLVYVSGEAGVRRYRAADGEGCALELDERFGDRGTLAPPVKQAKPQTVGKGPVYMRSGGPEWQVVVDGEKAYLYDFLLGIYRIDRGRLEPVCPDVQGLRGLVVTGGSALSGRDKGVRVALGGACKVAALAFDPPPRFGVAAAGGETWGMISSGKLVRYGRDGKAAATIGNDKTFDPGGLCSTTSVASCGDAVCVLDGNCTRVSRFATDGTHQLERKLEQLLGERPYAVAELAAAPDDGLWLLARQKDGDTCEAAVYRIPGAALRP